MQRGSRGSIAWDGSRTHTSSKFGWACIMPTGKYVQEIKARRAHFLLHVLEYDEPEVAVELERVPAAVS